MPYAVALVALPLLGLATERLYFRVAWGEPRRRGGVRGLANP